MHVREHKIEKVFLLKAPEQASFISHVNEGSFFSHFELLFEKFGFIHVAGLLTNVGDVLYSYLNCDVIEITSYLLSVRTSCFSTCSSFFVTNLFVCWIFCKILIKNNNLLLNKFLNLILDHLIPSSFLQQIFRFEVFMIIDIFLFDISLDVTFFNRVLAFHCMVLIILIILWVVRFVFFLANV